MLLSVHDGGGLEEAAERPYAGTSFVLLSLSMVERLILMDYKYPF